MTTTTIDRWDDREYRRLERRVRTFQPRRRWEQVGGVLLGIAWLAELWVLLVLFG